jgi:hypothetical protein
MLSPSLNFTAQTRPDSLHQLGGLGAQLELHALLFERGLQHLAGGAVELALHDPVGDMHHGHVHAAQGQAVGGLEAQQAGADDHRVPVLGRGVDHLVGVLDVAVGDHAGQVVAGDGRMKGVEPVAISRRS